MSKKKTENIEDAEIVASDDVRPDYKDSYPFKSQVIILYIVFLALFVMIASFFIYYQRKITSDLQSLQVEINSFSPQVSLKTVESKLNDLEISVRRENISRIDEAVRTINDGLIEKLESLPKFKNSQESLNLMKEDLTKFKLKFERYIAETKILPNKNIETQSFKLESIQDLANELESLETNFDIRFDSLVNRFDELEQEFVVSKKTVGAISKNCSR